MHDKILADILARLNDLESNSVRIRGGTLVDDSPLTVDLGDAGVDLLAAQSTGNRIIALKAGNNPPIVLGGDVPSARVYNDATQSIPNNTGVDLVFNTERWDNDGIHVSGSDRWRLTCVTAGLYSICGHVAFVANATGYRQVGIRKNGAAWLDLDTAWQPGASFECALNCATTDRLAVGDYVSLQVYQSSGIALNVAASSANNRYEADFEMARLSP